MKIIISGSRKGGLREEIESELKGRLDEIDYIIEGGAEGVDSEARELAWEIGIPVLEIKANWDKYGNKAGPIRNTRMINLGSPDEVWIFHKRSLGEMGPGTKNMLETARKHDIPVRKFIHVDDVNLDLNE